MTNHSPLVDFGRHTAMSAFPSVSYRFPASESVSTGTQGKLQAGGKLPKSKSEFQLIVTIFPAHNFQIRNSSKWYMSTMPCKNFSFRRIIVSPLLQLLVR